jgi:hypothetical protein
MAILDAAAKRKYDVYKQAPNTTQLGGQLVAFVVSSSGVIGKDVRVGVQVPLHHLRCR